jgi:trans-2-enoyl-CoA reductase
MDTNTPQQPSKMQQVLAVLQEKGYTDDQIAEVMDQIGQMAFNQLYAASEALFEDEDFVEIGEAANPEGLQKKIFEVYEKRTGENPQVQLNTFLDTVATNFLDSVNNPSETSNPPVNPSE